MSSAGCLCAVVLAAATLGGSQQSPEPVGGSASARGSAVDDRAILIAVLEHSIWPEHKKNRPMMPLKVLAESVSMCDGNTSTRCLSRRAADMIRLEVLPKSMGFSSSAGPQPGELIPSPAARDVLVSSIIDRNTESHALPISGVADLTMIATPDWAKQTVAEREAALFAGFGLPGFSGDGHALVYGFLDCGARCGSGWLFLLNKSADAWQVRSRYMLWIR